MTSCNEFKIKIPKDTPDYKLYDELKKDYGVTDAEIDAHGYHVVNYAEAGKQPTLLGTGDCEIAAGEVREFALDDWKKYRAPIERLIGSGIPWALDDTGSPFPKNKAQKEQETNFFKQVDNLLKLIETKLSKKSLSKNDDDYIEGKSVALYWFQMTPEKKFLDLWPQIQKKDLKKEIEESLKPYGLQAVAKYLIKNGGKRDNHLPIFSFSLPGLNFAFPNLFNSDLYGLFEYAGLSPQFVEIFSYTDDNSYKCGAPLAQLFVVGQKIGDRFRLFDGYLANPDVKRMYYYPVHKEDIIEMWIANRQLFDTAFGDEPQKVQGLYEPSHISLLSQSVDMMKMYDKLDEKEASQKITDKALGIKNKAPSNPYFLFFADFFLSFALDNPSPLEELFQNPLPPIKGEAYRIAAEESLNNDNNKKAIDYAKELLKLDGKCSFGYEAVALANSQLGNLEDAKANFEKAEELDPLGENHTKMFYKVLGQFHLDQEHLSESIAAFEKYLTNPGAKKNVDYATVQLLQGIALEKNKDKKGAEKTVVGISKTIKTYISDADLEKAEKIVKTLDEKIKQYKPKIGSLCQIYANLGQLYLYHNRLEEAEKLFGKAEEFNSSFPLLILLKKQLQMMKDQRAKQ